MHSIVLVAVILGAPAPTAATPPSTPVIVRVEKEESGGSIWAVVGRVCELVIASGLTLGGAWLLARRAEWFKRLERAGPLAQQLWERRASVYAEATEVCGIYQRFVEAKLHCEEFPEVKDARLPPRFRKCTARLGVLCSGPVTTAFTEYMEVIQRGESSDNTDKLVVDGLCNEMCAAYAQLMNAFREDLGVPALGEHTQNLILLPCLTKRGALPPAKE